MELKLKNIKIIDKYIAKQILFGLFIVSSILLGIAWFSQIIRLLSYLVNNNLSFWAFLKMTSLLLPDLLVIILPIALFAVILFVYNRLTSDKELIIMEAVGMSVRDLSKPTLFLTSIITLLCFFVTLYISPIYATKYRTFLFDSQNDISAILIQEGEFNQITEGLTIYVKSSKDNILSDIFINDQRQKNRIRTILAERGIISTTNNNISLALVNGSIQEKAKEKYTFGSFEKYTADLGVVAKNAVRSKRPAELSLIELLNAKELGYADEKNYPKYLVEFHKRLVQPLYNMIFSLIGLLAIFKSPLNKRSNSKNMIFAVSGMIGYQMLYISLFNMLRVHPNSYPIIYAITLISIIVMIKYLYSDSIFVIKRLRGKNA
ncbi:MAG: LPS export ABC transporter permease LptF [Alphaproteobacteria bacterium]|nr:LPS export ABC transporter permease LptF [Alphaproteobacteria bacterium]